MTETPASEAWRSTAMKTILVSTLLCLAMAPALFAQELFVRNLRYGTIEGPYRFTNGLTLTFQRGTYELVTLSSEQLSTLEELHRAHIARVAWSNSPIEGVVSNLNSELSLHRSPLTISVDLTHYGGLLGCGNDRTPRPPSRTVEQITTIIEGSCYDVLASFTGDTDLCICLETNHVLLKPSFPLLPLR